MVQPQRGNGQVGALAPQRVVVFRVLVLGDMLCAVPAFRALRAALPKAHLVLVGLPWAREFAARFSRYFDDFIEFPGFPGLPERTPNLGQFPGFLQAVQQSRFDLAIQMHGSGLLTNPLTALFDAQQNAGFYPSGQCCPDPDWFLPHPDHGSEVERLLELIDFLGIPRCGTSLEFPLQENDHESLHKIPQARRLRPGTYVCVHPGASVAAKRWRLDGFAAVADALAQRGLKIVLTGSLTEADLADALVRQMRHPAINLAGRTTLGTLGALLSGARLLVCNDTGVSHVAGALRVPSVVVVLNSDPVRWAPLDQRRHRVLFHPATCRPCGQAVCPSDSPQCQAISIDAVTQAALDVLDDFASEPAIAAQAGHTPFHAPP